ncbi:MAG: hypothetical protein HYY25_00420 [Candidatus Wallbacteria bacterium]|nr:hypothetical protein [Candidatus Wallbacteria bacterium]
MRRRTAPVEGVPAEAGRRNRLAREAGFILLIWMSAAVYFWPVLFEGKSLYFRDTVAIYMPQARTMMEGWRSGQIPLWEPKLGYGYPFQADPHSMVFYPLAVILFLFPWPLAYNIFTVVHVPLLGTLLYALLRRWRMPGPAAAFGAAVAMFSGFTASSTCLTTLLRGLTWAPAALLAFDWYLRSGGARAVAATGFLLAVQGSGTDPQYVFFSGLLVALSPWLRPLPVSVSAPRLAGGLAGAATVAGALLAYQFLPLAELIAQSNRRAGLATQEVAGYAVRPVELLNLAVPVAFPDPVSPYYYFSYHKTSIPLYGELYLGVFVLALAATALIRPGRVTPRLRAAGAWLALALGALLLCLGDSLPFFEWLNRLVPPLRSFRYPSKYFLLTNLAVSVAAAFGFEQLWRGRRKSLRAVSLLLGAALLAAAAGWGLIATGGDTLARRFVGCDEATWSTLGEVSAALVSRSSADLLMLAGMAGAAAAVLGFALGGRVPARAAAAFVAIVALVDLAATTVRDVLVTDDALVDYRPVTAQKLLAGTSMAPPRFLTTGLGDMSIRLDRTAFSGFYLETAAMTGNRGVLHGANGVAGETSVRLAGYEQLRRLMLGPITPELEAVAAATGVEHLLCRPGPGDRIDEGRVVTRSGPVVMQRLPGASSRAFIAKSAMPISAGRVRTTTELVLSLAQRAVYETAGNPGGETEKLRVGGPDRRPARVGRCEVERYGTQELAVSFELEGKGLLVVLDQHYPGWKAFVDGRERPVLRVAGAFRGVEVEGGERRLLMRYDPWTFRIGSRVSALTLLATLVLLVLPWGRSARERFLAQIRSSGT